MTKDDLFQPDPRLDLVLERVVDLRPWGIFRTVMRSPKQHEALGYHDGWGKALDQLVAVAKRRFTSEPT
jgi:hypothetical protein